MGCLGEAMKKQKYEIWGCDAILSFHHRVFNKQENWGGVDWPVCIYAAKQLHFILAVT